MPVTLGTIIRKRRLELGLTQEQLAERISAHGEFVRQSEISRIESGAVGLPRRARLERIAAALDVPLGELLAHSGWSHADLYLGTPPNESRIEEASNVNGAGQQHGAHDRPIDRLVGPVVQHVIETEFALLDSNPTIIETFPRREVSTSELRGHREALGRAMHALETEKERLLRNRRAVQDLEHQFSRRRNYDPSQSN
jgi:transcriptional regulator with XRE-family HTH domain